MAHLTYLFSFFSVLLTQKQTFALEASGKSNVIKALEFFKNYIIDSFKNLQAVQIINWLTDTSILTCSDEERMWNMAVNHLDDAEMRSRIVEFSKFADLGIEDIEKSDNHILSLGICSEVTARW